MSRKPQKLSLKLEPDNVCEFKRIDCKFYGICLEDAAQAAWPQFHCNDCTEYEPDLELFKIDCLEDLLK